VHKTSFIYLFIYLLEEIDEETEHFAKIRGKSPKM